MILLFNIASSDQAAQWLRRWFLILLLVHLVTSIFSHGVFHCDEHFQIIEFVGFKLGWVSPEALPWEYTAQIRPWLQPFLYFIPTKALAELGFRDPFILEGLMRILSGLLGWGSLTLLARSLYRYLNRTSEAFWITLLFSSFFFLPQFHVRTSSESMSSAFLMLSFALALKLVDSSPGNFILKNRNLVWSNPPFLFALFGSLLGIAFAARYQVAFAGLGLALLVFVKTPHKIDCAFFGTLGGVLTLALAAVIDFWGYGNWVFPPYRYLSVNLLEGKAAEFGVSPWWAYFVSLRKNFLNPYGTLIVTGIILSAWIPLQHFWILRKQRTEFTPIRQLGLALASVILPFVIIHMAIGHKENRFLYPIVWCSWLLFLLQLGIPFYRFIAFRNLQSHVLRPLFTIHVILTLILVMRNAFTELESRTSILKEIKTQSKHTERITLRILDGVNPYALGCGSSNLCNSNLVAEFIQPKNLLLDCRNESQSPLAGSLALQTYTRSPELIPAPPPGCRSLISTQATWMVHIAEHIPVNMRDLVFKNHRFHVLWDCR